MQPFSDESEAIAWANGTPYGLAASVWTRDVLEDYTGVKHVMVSLS